MSKKIAWCVITNNENDLISIRRFVERQQYLKSIYPVKVLLGNNLKESSKLNILTDNNIDFEFVPDLEFNTTQDRYKNTFIKISAFLATDYDLLCFIETDTIIKNNIDSIINDNIDFEGPVGFINHLGGDTHILGLCYLVRPNKDIYNKLIDFATNSSYTLDENLFTDFFCNYLNKSKMEIQQISKKYSDFLITSIFHFPGFLKPWDEHIKSLHSVYYDLSAKDFNKWIDDAIKHNLLNIFRAFININYKLTSIELEFFNWQAGWNSEIIQALYSTLGGIKNETNDLNVQLASLMQILNFQENIQEIQQVTSQFSINDLKYKLEELKNKF